jgi:glucokinase
MQEFVAVLNQCTIIFPGRPCTLSNDCGTNGNNLSYDGNALTHGIMAPYLMTNPGNGRVLTFDVGGSHVSAAVCLQEDYRLGPVVREQYGSIETSDGFIDLLCRLGAEAATGGENGMGATLAVPGPFNFQAGISLMRHKLPYLYGVDLRRALAKRLGCEPDQVRFLNDADAYLLGEIGAGAARGFCRVIGLTLGTGIGSAFAVNGKLVTEGPGVPPGGEIWNVPYEGGIVEDFVSARAIVSHYEQSTGRVCSVAALAEAAAHNRAAAEAFTVFGRNLGRVLHTVVADFHADLIVLGGGIARSPDLFLPSTRSELQNGAPELRVSELMDRAPLVGCGVAWFNDAGRSSDEGRAAAALDGAIQA